MYEFVKYGKNYIVKNSNGRIVSEKEKIQMENKELILKDISGCNCQKETTKKLTKNKKRLKEIEQEEAIIENVAKKYEYVKDNIDYNKTKKPIKIETAQTENGDVADDIIKKTTEII